MLDGWIAKGMSLPSKTVSVYRGISIEIGKIQAQRWLFLAESK